MEVLLQASWPQGADSASWCQDKVELDIWHVQYGLGVPQGVWPHHRHEGHWSLRLWTWGEWLGTCERTAGDSVGMCVRSLMLLCIANFEFSDFQRCNRILLLEEWMPTVISHPHHGQNQQGSCYQHHQQQILPICYSSSCYQEVYPEWYYSKTDLSEMYHIVMGWHISTFITYTHQSVSPWPSIQTWVYCHTLSQIPFALHMLCACFPHVPQ